MLRALLRVIFMFIVKLLFIVKSSQICYSLPCTLRYSLFALDLLYLFITEKNSEANATYQQQGIKRGAEKTNKQDKKARWNDDEEESGGEGSDSADSEEEITPNKTKQQNIDEKKGSSKENEFEVVPVEDNSKFNGPFRLCFFFHG